MKNDSMAVSIKAAFNLGVWMRQNADGRDVFEVGACLKETIYYNIDRPEDGDYTKEVIDANVDCLLQIALLGYLMSGICSYDEALKDKIPALIEKRLVADSFLDTPGDYSGDVSDAGKGTYYGRLKSVGMN